MCHALKEGSSTPTPIFAGSSAGPIIYRVGRAGYDTGAKDVDPSSGYVYTGILKTERISPLGEDGLCYFRRVVLRIWRTGAFTVTLKFWVDGKRTQVFASDGSKTDQEVTVTMAAPVMVDDQTSVETIVEGSLMAQGTYIEVEISVDSDDITGVFLPETVEIHYLPVREVRGRPDGAVFPVKSQ